MTASRSQDPPHAAGGGRRFTDEQRAAIDDRSGARLLAANAGSGKTAVMVERFVDAVAEDGVAVGAILALTFTEKAAGELRDRIRRRLTERGRHDDARAAEGAWLGTIHGFCARVLRTSPLAAGLDPGFTVMDEPAARRAADAAWALAVEAWAEREGAPAIEVMAGAGAGLREVVLQAHAERRSRGLPVALPPVPDGPVPDRAALEAARAEAAKLLVTGGSGVRVEAARAALDACEAVLAGDGVPRAGLLDAAKMSNGAKVLGEAPCVAYREAWAAFRAACADHHARAAMPLLDGLLREFSAQYEQIKAQRAALDFEDLQLRVRDLLAADDRLRARWAERFELIMVDEFQDTNRLQLDILERLERDNLFAVGDELQSIYGFRHADVTIFRDRAAALGPRGTKRLRANFRSREELLDVLNGAFVPIFGDAFAPLVAGATGAPPRAPAGDVLQLFDPDRIGATGEPPVELLLTDTKAWEEQDEEAADAVGAAIPGVPLWRRAEAVRVARRLRREVDGGRRPGDLVVLVRAAASLRLFEQALEEAGLPTYVVGGRGYWSQEQVRDGIAYLSALANPLDETALLAVLASPFAGVGADGLVAAARAGRERGGLWAALQAGVEKAEGDDRRRLHGFAAFFAAERAGAERRPLEVLLERAVAATGYDLATLARPGGERRLANLRKLMRMAREYERSEGRDLRGFLASVTGQDLVTAREGEAALESEGLDAVRLMTIHRAKGLEFPVVCVADLGRQGPGDKPRLLLGRDGRLGLRLRALGEPKAVAALDWDALAAERDEAEAAEERRLMYVAMTRAEDRLILSGGVDMTRWPAARPGGPPIDWIAPTLLGDPRAAVENGVEVFDRPFEGRPARVRVRLNRPADLAADVLPPRRAPSAGTALPAVATVDPPPPHQPALAPMLRRLSYSSLGQYGRCGYRFYLQRGLGLADVEPPPGTFDAVAEAGGLDPRVRGSLVHLLLERLDFRRPLAPSADAVREAAASLGAALDDEDVADAASLVMAFARSELCGRLARARSVRREAPFAFALEPGPHAPLIHGIVDVIAREASGTLIVDYKTDRLGDTDPVELTERAYGTQRAVYALAALREGVERVDVAHCFLERPERTALATFTATDVPALEERVLGLAGGLLAGRFPVAEEPHRELCATCPGRRALCSHPHEMTLREPHLSVAGTFSGSGGPS